MKNSSVHEPDYKKIWLFIIPSLLGVLLFMIPFKFDGQTTIFIAVISNYTQELLSNSLTLIITILICSSFILSIVAMFLKNDDPKKLPYFKKLFTVTPLWLIIKAIGAVFVLLTFFEIGPEFIWSADTGGTLLNDLLPVLLCVFLYAGVLLPLLVNFGLLEFIGALFTKIMRPLFKLPGRSAVDCIASWVGDGTIGVLLTSKQYEGGFYTEREACVIGTTFSFVSISFSLVVLSQVELTSMFPQYYLTIIIVGLVAAFIMPRIPPLSRKKDVTYNNIEHDHNEAIPAGISPAKWGTTLAIEAAKKNTVKGFFTDGIHNVFDMWFSIFPIVMAIGTTGLILATYTPLFKWLGLPFLPLLKLLQIPEAAAASQTILIGFTDMFLPSVIATSITSDMTRFIIAALSVSQLVYMSEVGGLLLGSIIPVSFKDLVIIFLERTLITLPLITLMAHIFF